MKLSWLLPECSSIFKKCIFCYLPSAECFKYQSKEGNRFLKRQKRLSSVLIHIRCGVLCIPNAPGYFSLVILINNSLFLYPSSFSCPLSLFPQIQSNVSLHSSPQRLQLLQMQLGPTGFLSSMCLDQHLRSCISYVFPL